MAIYSDAFSRAFKATRKESTSFIHGGEVFAKTTRVCRADGVSESIIITFSQPGHFQGC